MLMDVMYETADEQDPPIHVGNDLKVSFSG